MLCGLFDRVAILQRSRKVPNIHLGPGLAGLDVFQGLNRRAKQPTPPLSSEAAHIRPPFRDSFPSNIQGRR